ncbi:MAG: threonine synthase [Candidatus Bathyarchaeota archaeon]|jgi:threonine synthase|nr:threonine synthase [Candidatus Bathyarchaeota archaeon]
MVSRFMCVDCGRNFELGLRLRCKCRGLLEVVHEFPWMDRAIFDERLSQRSGPYRSGVWRFKELVYSGLDMSWIVSKQEGNTNIYAHQRLKEYTGIRKITVKHEGENPSGSFKDRGMTVGISEAARLGVSSVACASTGNTSASLASFAATNGMNCIVFIPEGMIAYGKLAQALSYGATVLQVRGDFDAAMWLVQEASAELGLYLLNSVNPWRIEGQKSIIFELIQQRGWESPDWIVLPAGNLGNTSAFGKALRELKSQGLIDAMPRLASIQAEGANPFYSLWAEREESLIPIEPYTVASAIKIGNPVSWKKAIRVIEETNGVVEQVSDQEIMDAKAVVGRCGVGCEPASAASVAGARKLVDVGIINPQDDVVCILTGNLLKDPGATVNYHTGVIDGVRPRFANTAVVVNADLASVEAVLNNRALIGSRNE